MKIYDISMAINENIPVYGNLAEKRPVITVTRERAGGDVYESRIAMDMHTGTHIDAPLHMLEGGGTIDGVEAERLFAPCSVLDFSDISDCITDRDLKRKNIREGTFVLLKTRNSLTQEFEDDFVYLAASGAEYLTQMRVAGVGTDALGIERSQPGFETHKTLFKKGIIIIEGLRLKGIPEGEYTLAALPLRIEGAEAAPARAILIEE